MLRIPTLEKTIIPGFTITMGFTLIYLAAMVLLPLLGMAVYAFGMSGEEFWRAVSSRRVMAAYRVSFGLALLAALVNSVLGFDLAWVLVRYRFAGKKMMDALVDLPFALPTAVAGVALAALYGPHGWIGEPLGRLGIQISYTKAGIMLALMFVGLPFVVRTVQPVLEDMNRELEEAALSLGATRVQTFYHVIIPTVMPAVCTGFAMAFARGLGEYGSVIFIAGNIPYMSEIVPLLIVTQLEQYNYYGATAIALVMLVVSFMVLLAINWLQQWSRFKRSV